MDEVQKFRCVSGGLLPTMDEGPCVFVGWLAYAKLLQALSDAATNTLTICGLRDMAVKRAEEAEAERDALKERQQRESGRIPCPCDPIQCVMEYDNLRARIASLEAQLSACTKPLPDDITSRLLSACNGHPNALIPWPHRLLHDAVAHIDAQATRIAELEADYETMRGACGAAQNRILEVAQERDAAKAQLSAPRPGVNWCLRSHKQAERICELLLKVASLEAQLTACTFKHYGQMAEEAKKHSRGQGHDAGGAGRAGCCISKPRRVLCIKCLHGLMCGPQLVGGCTNANSLTYICTTSEDSCTGFAERPQTQGL